MPVPAFELTPQVLGDDPWSPPVDSEPIRIPEVIPFPAMPALQPPDPPATTAAEAAEDAEQEDYDRRLGALEAQLTTSQAALEAVTTALRATQNEMVGLRADLTRTTEELRRLEQNVEAQHLADLDSLDQLSTAMDALIERVSVGRSMPEGERR